VTERPDRLEWVGHSCVVIDLEGVRLVTDPLLADRCGHLRRMTAPAALPRDVDAALVSHLHLDHLHGPSLRRIAPRLLVAPRGAGRFLADVDPVRVVEVEEGDEVAVGPLTVRAVHADHDGRRRPGLPAAPALGYVVDGAQTVYFAGDTGPFAAMAGLVAPPLDMALLPVWGWGRRLGPGHLDPLSAAQALTLLNPRRAVPVHWGTYAPAWTRRPSAQGFLHDPPRDFARHAARLAPGVEVVVLEPGGSMALDPA
jgi:L-ascorbate metabolism protein UlaG (beta-lactamase superfamily)